MRKYKRAFDFIFEQAIPDEEAIDRMSQDEVEEYLADSGVDLEELKKHRAEEKRYFAGKFAFLSAKKCGSEKPHSRDRSQPLRRPTPDAERPDAG